MALIPPPTSGRHIQDTQSFKKGTTPFTPTPFEAVPTGRWRTGVAKASSKRILFTCLSASANFLLRSASPGTILAACLKSLAAALNLPRAKSASPLLYKACDTSRRASEMKHARRACNSCHESASIGTGRGNFWQESCQDGSMN